MRIQSFICSGLCLAALLLSVSASPVGNTTEPEILVTASFAEDNPFGHVVNGEKNKITLTLENNSDRNVTVTSIAGSFHHPETNDVIKNVTTLQYGIRLVEGTKLQIPYTFYSEFKPGDIRLNIWLEHAVDDEKYRVTAYDSIVTVVEPEVSIYDLKLLSTYLVVAALLGALTYVAYLTFVPHSKKPRKAGTSAPVDNVTATPSSGYQEEWIPEHHLKKPKGGKKQSGVVSSGDELSSGESEVKKRKGRK